MQNLPASAGLWVWERAKRLSWFEKTRRAIARMRNHTSAKMILEKLKTERQTQLKALKAKSRAAARAIYRENFFRTHPQANHE